LLIANCFKLLTQDANPHFVANLTFFQGLARRIDNEELKNKKLTFRKNPSK